MQQISIYLSTLFRPFLSNEFLRKWVKHKTGQLFTFECRLLSNNALVSFAIKERFKSRFSGSGFYNMQKMSKGDYMEMDCTLCNAQYGISGYGVSRPGHLTDSFSIEIGL